MAVVVVGDRPSSLWVVLAVMVVMLVIVGVILFLFFGRGQSGLLIVAIPGFPIESIVVGIVLGLSFIALRRRSIGKRRT